MKRVIFLLVLILPLFFISCDKEEFNEELHNKIIGSWDIVSYMTYSDFNGDMIIEENFHISDSSKSEHFLKALHFKESRFLEREFCNMELGFCYSGTNYDYRWEINRSLKVSHFYFNFDAEILKLTDSEFHFILTGKYESQYTYEIRREEYKLKR